MSIPVKLEAFEGPLDLLLHLIDKNKINIYDIPIVEITDQYLDYIKHMENKDLEVMSEFLVMAATLINIKSRMLLPIQKKNDEEDEVVDPRQELVDRLLEYKMFKYVAEILKEKILLREEGSGTRHILLNCLKSKGISIDNLNILGYIEDTETIKELVLLD